MQLVLSLFPGIGLLDMAFEQEGFCVVRGPDVLWGGDIRRFHPLTGKFDGVIGGPPCQAFSELVKLVRHNGHKPKFGNLIPEFARVVNEAQPQWFVMENVKNAPNPDCPAYEITSQIVRDCDVGGETMRRRKFWFGGLGQVAVRFVGRDRPLLPIERAVTGNSRVLTTGERIRNKERVGTAGGCLPGAGKMTPIADVRALQGVPLDFCAYSPFRTDALRQMLGNGVPIPMGRAIARAVKEAIGS